MKEPSGALHKRQIGNAQAVVQADKFCTSWVSWCPADSSGRSGFVYGQNSRDDVTMWSVNTHLVRLLQAQVIFSATAALFCCARESYAVLLVCQAQVTARGAEPLHNADEVPLLPTSCDQCCATGWLGCSGTVLCCCVIRTANINS